LNYAHFEIGAYTLHNTKAGTQVKIPLSIVGVNDNTYVGGFEEYITLGECLEFDTDKNCVEWDTTTMSSFASKFVNSNKSFITAVDFGAAENQTTSFQGSGLVGYILCRVTDKCANGGSNATIALSEVSISGVSATDYLNSTDGTSSAVDSNAVIFEGTKVGNSPVSPTGVHGNGDYRIVATDTNNNAVVVANDGDIVDVKVTVKGGNYVGAAVKLYYDTDNLELVDGPDGWDASGEGYAYFNVDQNGGEFPEDTVIGTLKFKAKALSTKVDAHVTLDESYVADLYEQGWEKKSANLVDNTGVTITIKGKISGISEPTENTFSYDGEKHASNPLTLTGTAEGAIVTYSTEENGTYNETYPEETNAGTYKIYYKVEKEDYTTATGSYDMVITPKDVTITVPEGQGKIYGDTATEELKYTVDGLVDGDSFDAEIKRKTGEVVGTYEITVTPGENPNYRVTANNGGTFEITPATLSDVKIDNNTVTYDGEYHAAANITLPDGLTLDDFTIKYSTDGGNTWSDKEPKYSEVGEYKVTYKVTKNNDTNYDPLVKEVTLTINKASVTIRVTDAEMVQYGSMPDFEYEVDGLAKDKVEKVNISCNTDGTKVGKFDINAECEDTKNYNVVSIVAGKLTVEEPNFVVEVHKEYVASHDMILVHTNDDNCTFSYNGSTMYDVSDAEYPYKDTDTTYKHVYAIVVDSVEGDNETALETTAKAKIKVVNTEAVKITYADEYNGLDVNDSGKVDLNDAVAVVAVYNVNSTYLKDHMDIVLKSDITCDKFVDGEDFSKIRSYYINGSSN
jgi:hypothetical protein